MDNPEKTKELALLRQFLMNTSPPTLLDDPSVQMKALVSNINLIRSILVISADA